MEEEKYNEIVKNIDNEQHYKIKDGLLYRIKNNDPTKKECPEFVTKTVRKLSSIPIKCLENVRNYEKIWCPEFFEVRNLSRHEKFRTNFG